MNYTVFELQIICMFIVGVLIPFVWIGIARLHKIKYLLIVILLGLIYLGGRLAVDNFQIIYCSQQINLLTRAIASYQQLESNSQDTPLPRSLGQLVPKYIPALPKCPAAGKDTYTKSYHPDYYFDTYKLYCSGSHHGFFKRMKNTPYYDAKRGRVIF